MRNCFALKGFSDETCERAPAARSKDRTGFVLEGDIEQDQAGPVPARQYAAPASVDGSACPAVRGRPAGERASAWAHAPPPPVAPTARPATPKAAHRPLATPWSLSARNVRQEDPQVSPMRRAGRERKGKASDRSKSRQRSRRPTAIRKSATWVAVEQRTIKSTPPGLQTSETYCFK